jgi:hypothetical protein
MLNATPVLSSRISVRIKDDGVMVGKGPAVSVGETVQLPDPLPEPEPLPLPVSVVLVFLQAAKITGADAAPMNMFFKKCLRSMIVVLMVDDCCYRCF